MEPFNPFDCDHPNEAMRWRTRRNGITVCVIQCLRCGRELRGVRRSDPTRRALTTQVPFDEELEQRTRADWMAFIADESHKVQTAWSEQRAAEQAEWWRKYSAYLLTPEWRERRRRVLERDNWLCQACRVRRATQAHHLTYKHVFHEPLFDLVAVCTVCHEALHADRSIEEAA
jgi:hypothetical protein